MKVRDIMTANPGCVTLNDTIEHAARMMKLQGVGAVPVCVDKTLFGIITDRDIAVECVASGRSPTDCRVKDYMTAEAISIGPDADAAEALELMGREQVRRLCVVDDQHLVGIVSLGDLAIHVPDADGLARTLALISQPVRSGEPVSR